MTRAVQARVTGQVQGVSFRAYAAREAVRLELVGWVRNEPDGSVLAHVEGPPDDVAEMLRWCQQGAPSAEVHRVEVRDVAVTELGEFSVRYES